MRERDDALAWLEGAGLVETESGRARPTKRFRAAMMRAAARLYDAGDPGDDLRVPVAWALCELLGDRVSDTELAGLVDAMTPVEAEELASLQGRASAG